VQLVICEPFALKCGAVNDKWFPEFDERRAAAKKVAAAAGAIFVPFQTIFDEAVAAGTPPAYWGGDGVHPSPAGHSLMAQAWRKGTGI
jgi:lysophospholipase L1-like esterase